MSDISALEGRITAALDRIRQGLDGRASDAAPDASLQAALAEERASNAELVERVRILKERQDTQVASLTGRVESQRSQLMKLDAELQQLRASNVQLRDMNAKLRETVTTGLSPELHNDAVAAEVAALHAQRTADAAELDAILAELKPLIEETPHAAG
jgi:chromosome segregation ATPase